MDIEVLRNLLPHGAPAPETLQGQSSYTYNEIFGINTYGFNPDDPNGVGVLDIGANIGFFSILAAIYGARLVVAVEPDKKNYAQLKENVAAFASVITLNMAAHDGQSDACRVYDQGTIAKVAFDGHKEVEARSLEQLTGLMPNGAGNVLKIDAEGSEFDIVLAAPKSVLRQYKWVLMEIHGEEGGTRGLKFLKDHMIAMGYEINYVFPVFWWTWDSSGKVVDCKKLEIEIVKFQRIDA